MSDGHQEQVNAPLRDQIAALDKRMAVMEKEMQVEIRQLREAQTATATNMGRLVWLFAAGMAGAIINFIVNGGLSIAGQ